MTTQTTLKQWQRRTEWPLAAVARAIWGLFILDYIARLYLAPDSLRWFLRHLLDPAFVALPLLRPLRLLRLVLLIEVLQKAVGSAFRGRIAAFTASGLTLLIYVAALAVFDSERDQPGATINSFGKAVWWSITTVISFETKFEN